MIYRYRVYEKQLYETEIYEELDERYSQLTNHYKNTMRSLLEGFPQQLELILDEAEVHNEIVDLDKQEAYIKITTEINEGDVSDAVQKMLKINGLSGSKLN